MALVDRELPTRKPKRLPEHDYRKSGTYFLTIITQERVEALGKVVNGKVELSSIGKAAANCVAKIEEIYPSAVVVDSVVMPNHVHILLQLLDDTLNPSVPRIVSQWKAAVSKQAKYSLWQSDFDDRLIMTNERYRIAAAYIKSNPSRWKNDRYNPQNENILEPPLACRCKKMHTLHNPQCIR